MQIPVEMKRETDNGIESQILLLPITDTCVDKAIKDGYQISEQKTLTNLLGFKIKYPDDGFQTIRALNHFLSRYYRLSVQDKQKFRDVMSMNEHDISEYIAMTYPENLSKIGFVPVSSYEELGLYWLAAHGEDRHNGPYDNDDFYRFGLRFEDEHPGHFFGDGYYYNLPDNYYGVTADNDSPNMRGPE